MSYRYTWPGGLQRRRHWRSRPRGAPPNRLFRERAGRRSGAPGSSSRPYGAGEDPGYNNAQSSIQCMSYSTSWGFAAAHQPVYGALYDVLLGLGRVAMTSCAPRRYENSESEVELARPRGQCTTVLVAC